MKRVLLSAVTAGLLLAGTMPAALAGPPDDGCARGFVLWDVETEPYQADRAVDEAGNANGYVCARRLGAGLSRQYGIDLPIYLFTDDTLTPGP